MSLLYHQVFSFINIRYLWSSDVEGNLPDSVEVLLRSLLLSLLLLPVEICVHELAVDRLDLEHAISITTKLGLQPGGAGNLLGLLILLALGR